MIRIAGLRGQWACLGAILVTASCTELSTDGLDLDHPAVGNPSPNRNAVSPISVIPKDRIVTVVDQTDRVTIPESRHPLATTESDQGPVPPTQRLDSIILALKPDESQEQALTEVIRQQQDPTSPRYQQWLSPEDFGAHFGVSSNDLARVKGWLESQGMAVREIAANGRAIVFSGEVSQVEAAFHTQMHAYDIEGEQHIANATDPQIPRALSPVVSGVVSLHDFHSQPSNVRTEVTTPGNTYFANGTLQARIVPRDLATIYNIAPLYAAGIDGTGQSIAVLGRSNIDLANVRTFRGTMGLPANDPQIVLAGSNPGILCGGDEVESYLDVEWAGAIARKATIKFVLAGSTLTTDGIYLAAQYAVTRNVAPIISLSYGLCEKYLGTAGNQFLNSLWQQAAAQGISVLVSSMDSGAAGCDAMNAAVAKGGLGVNGLGSTPYNTAVGGTQFDDATNRATYWSATNDPTTLGSALGYIPEMAWNESRGGGLYATGGGLSSIYAKPAWQFGLGVLPDGKRDLPDMSLVAAIQEPYLIYGDNQWMGSGGTSASTPVFAGMLALVTQKTGRPLGLVNPTLYTLAYSQRYRAGAAVFHDTTKGDNTVPGVTGYPSVVGYDMATGLGSVDANQLVGHWSEGATPPAMQLAAHSTAVSVVPGFSATLGLSTRMNNGLAGTITFSVSTLPGGVTAGFSPATVTTSGNTTLTLSAASNTTPGTYTITISAASSAGAASIPVSLTVVNQPSLTLAFAPSYIDVAAGGTGSTTLTTTRSSTFNATVSFTITGLPAGATAKFTPTSIAAPGAGSTVLAVTLAANTPGGTYAATVTASGGGILKTALVAINALPAPSFSLVLAPASVSAAPGSTGIFTATTIRTTSFNSAISVNVSGMPAGVIASKGTIAIPGSGITALSLAVGASVAGGSYSLTVTATGGGVTKTAPLTLLVPSPSYTVSPAVPTVKRGGSATLKITSAMLGGFSSAVVFSVSGLPTGVTGTFNPAMVPAPGNGSTTLTLSAAASAKTGAASLTIKATSGTVVKTMTVPINVT